MELRRLRWSFPPCPGNLRVALKSFGYQRFWGFGLSPKQLWGRGREPSQTPKFPAPFPWGGKRLSSVAVALSPALLGWGLSPMNCNLQLFYLIFTVWVSLPDSL